MCLLIVLAQTNPAFPLVVGANRDELLDRPAVPMTVLRDAQPRVLGGRDELAGGTWLAVNEHGVVAGLTNRPMAGQRDPSKLSRGELPLALAGHRSAASAVDEFVQRFRPSDYNPAWLLVGDRDALFSIDMTGDGGVDTAVVERLAPGVHILENHPMAITSPKAAHVRGLLAGEVGSDAVSVVDGLREVLSNHDVPAGFVPPPPVDGGQPVPPEVKAPCVHTERFGTRWSAVVTVPMDGGALPSVRYADGPPCVTPYRDAGALWSHSGAGAATTNATQSS